MASSITLLSKTILIVAHNNASDTEPDRPIIYHRVRFFLVVVSLQLDGNVDGCSESGGQGYPHCSVTDCGCQHFKLILKKLKSMTSSENLMRLDMILKLNFNSTYRDNNIEEAATANKVAAHHHCHCQAENLSLCYDS